MSADEDEARRLAEERRDAREAKDFAMADALRDRIRALGFDVRDSSSGFEVVRLEDEPPRAATRPSDVESVLDQPPTADVSVHWVVEGWPEDVERGIASFSTHEEGRTVQHVVVDMMGESRTWPDGPELLRVDPGMGWGAARNAGLRRSAGRIVLLVDGSVEATGDVIGPLEGAFEDPAVGVTGPFGITTDEQMHHFHESPGPDVDAIEGYLMAFRRDVFEAGVRFDEHFRFYRTADIDLCFQLKAMGLRATVTPVPVERHEHRMWTSTPEAERDRLSKRNYYRFLDRWRGRTDLLVRPT